MRNLTIAPDVAEVIGAQRAAELAAGPYLAEYRCTYCRRRGRVDAGEPLHAGVDVGPGYARLWIAHVHCGPAGVRLLPTAALPSLDETEATGFAYAGRAAGGQVVACIVVEIAMSAEVLDERGVADVGERRDLVLTGALAGGMQPAADPLCPPTPEGPLCWRVQLPSGGRGGGVYGRRRLQLLAPLPPIPPGWLDVVAARGGRCGLFLVARAGLTATWTGDLLATLTEAARDGRLVGTTAAVVP
ncbi:hypothetical protein [Micromonospora thermarum]|uniref:Uncharacterized protein n=1 Tax=Micromonospora thermarum TaxID=2720024 RepID=A0ABX0Z9B1_9ACTN|nr:hypothetical protein [Micromonospora thermarum]NJP33708.1 hypothetical protein [Micromonospora thermarum]